MRNFEILFFVVLVVSTTVCDGTGEETPTIDFTDPIFSKLNEEEKDIIKEYSKAYPKIRTFYGNIRMDVTEKIFRTTASKEPLTYIPLNLPPILESEELLEARYNLRDGYFYRRIDSQINFRLADSSEIHGKNIQVYYAKEISLLTPKKGYSLSKNNPNSQFYSLSAKQEPVGFRFVARGFDTAPFSVGPILMEDLFFRRARYIDKNTPYFVVSARYIEDEQEGQIVELVSWTDRIKSPSRPGTWTVRLLRSSWLIKDVLEQGMSGAGTKYWKRFRCEYNGEFEGMPLLTSYQIDVGIYDTDEAQTERTVQQIRYNVTKIVPGPVDLSEFDVAQFLPPGVKIGEVTTGLSTARIVAIVIGVILVIYGIYLKIRSARRDQRNNKT